jgi:hypothetical protein
MKANTDKRLVSMSTGTTSHALSFSWQMSEPAEAEIVGDPTTRSKSFRTA